MKRNEHSLLAVGRLFLFVLLVLLSGASPLRAAHEENTSAKGSSRTIDESKRTSFALVVTAESAVAFICTGDNQVGIKYTAAGNPETPNQYLIDADATAEAAGFADVDWKALTGSPLNYAVPANIAPGKYNFIFKVRDSNCASTCEASDPFTIEVKAADHNVVCSGQVNVNLQDGCQATLDWTNVLQGSLTCLDEANYKITVKDGDMSNGGVVDGCGKYEYAVTGPNGPECWGYVLAEDKKAPEIKTCPPTVYGTQKGYGYQEFVCQDLGNLLLPGQVSYTSDRDGNINYSNLTPAVKALLDMTGYAVFTDNCGDLIITVSDQVVYGYDKDCDDVKIIRKFQAKDACKGLLSEFCYQEIIITKPGLDDVHCPADAELSCDKDFKLDAKGNPHPDVTGYPWVYTAFDHTDDNKENYKFPLKQVMCNIGTSYKDGTRIDVCEGTYKFVRTWTILDWCSKETYECTQVIKVGDDKAPVVECETTDYNKDGKPDLRTYSTGPYDCTAAFQVPMPKVKENCSSWEVLTEVIAGSTSGPVVATILPGKPRYVSGIPLGCHYIKYTVTDACGNKEVVYCPFQVEDQIEPIAICDDDLNISIGGQGVARVYAKDIDEGSSDNCGPVRVEVRRRIQGGKNYECLENFDYNKNGKVIGDEIQESVQFGDPDGTGSGQIYYYTPWADYVDFTCCDMNANVRIELRVWDDRNRDGKPGNTIEKTFCDDTAADVKDNSNVCWMDVLVEDKLPAYCVPPLPKSIDCDKLPFNFDPENVEQMTTLFGTASGSDNCPGFTVKELAPLTTGLNDCGFGQFVRRFQVTDAKGQTSTNKCEQVVTLQEQHHYKIKFPKDAAANCGDPQPDTIKVEELGCDLLAISVKDDKFTASGDECYKIFRTYRVINWCEYDGISDPVVVSRDEDCDGKPGDEDVWVIVKTVNKPDPCHDYYGGTQAASYAHTWYDRDNDPFNLTPKAGIKGESCEYETNPYGFWKEVAPITENESKDSDNYPKGYYGNHCDDMASVGFWQYTQVIKVYDNVKPIIEYTQPEAFCSYSSDFGNDCPAPVTLNFTIDENCTPKDLKVTATLDAYSDGVMDGDLTASITGTYPNYSLKGNFPLGTHLIRISVKDGCGNANALNLPFEVVDCKAPAPICINGLAIELMPVIPAADVDGDGDADKGAMAIWASDFIASPSSDCTGEVKYSINRVGEAVDADQTGLTLTCDDDASLLVEIWAWDGLGNGDFCETYVLVQDNRVQCDGGTGSVSGVIVTEETSTVEGVKVELSGEKFEGMTTKANGDYKFNSLQTGFDYTVTPQYDATPLNGVSTFDLVLMSKHILGIKSLDSPYKRIAADINNDKKITALDAIALRKLILNIDTKFSSNTSWRFVSADYVFPNPENPWKEAFPEVININNVQGELAKKDFIAVKIGDMDLSAKANLLEAVTRSSNGRFLFQLEEQQLRAGQEYRVAFRADDLARIQGYQMTLQLKSGAVELVDMEYGVAQAANFGMQLAAEGLITTSWNRSGSLTEDYQSDEVLFTLLVKPSTDVRLSEVLSISSRLTVAEAYDQEDGLLDVGIEFSNGTISASTFELQQNVPNPFREETTIGFYLPEAGEVSLQVHDAAGRVIKLVRGTFAQGRNQIQLNRSDLTEAGVLYYTLTSGDFTATRKMIVVK
ncbi:T9SS type A sorting domain-containing protein [Flavilitoribacter nigricans]|uniref:T9SS type A sorting domain-containing protein n=1 Tax=Flavilitoribacter nigricans (strain ATCC 23147 / DSM 23189 / NBRC 102662 / NCIMB 1420 / SS-2) TaxID=1122177 RepID=A0A2D0MXV7_FLAN2|nr:T9SS type A sorting domain-containing protein [Flavilitoribacter nigricans]PHN01112.1 hypothetical protein CRP01_38905 [Flavilitoribacter nigricans DSM 23189 = NBRC 102662]